MWGKLEMGLINGLPLNEWLWLAGALVVVVLALYVIGQFIKVARRKG